MFDRNVLINFLNEYLGYSKQNDARIFFHQAFGAISVSMAMAYAKGDTAEEAEIADLWNNDYRHRFEELIYKGVTEQ